MKRSISRPLVGRPPSPLPTEGSITCSICQATYAPSRVHAYLLQTPPIALESAFLSMCHFCFRCRRPSCPNCWDATHSICGQCAHETHIPFRMPTPPLEGTTLLSARPNFSADNPSLPSSLVPIHPGRFQDPSPLPIQSTGSIVTSSASLPQHQASPDIDAIITRPDRSRPLDVDEVATRPDRQDRQAPPDIDSIATRPDRSKSLDIDDITPPPALPSKRKSTFIGILLLFIVLLLVIIIASLLFRNVNLSVYTLLRVDIRAELTAFWHFLQSLF